jgi:hypothetical protein
MDVKGGKMYHALENYYAQLFYLSIPSSLTGMEKVTMAMATSRWTPSFPYLSTY